MTSPQQTLIVDLGDRSYPIYIGSGLLQQSALLGQHITGKQVMVVTNSTIAPLYLQTVLDGLKGLKIEGFQVDSLVLEDGEKHKHLDTVNLIFDHLLRQRHNRTTTLIALGGGVIGDMTGYAAAAYQRGVNFIQMPTTLLSQVDSSVGGKTGVNHPLGKNMIGAFHQPQCVVIDTESLKTLPPRELSAGLAEVIKYGLIAQPDLFVWLEQNIEQLRQLAPQFISQAIYQSCECKARIVAADEREQGVRALLNFGHTFGHAIETEMGYGNWLHGEAVGAGMAMAADLSYRLGWLTKLDVQRIQDLLTASGLPLWGPEQMHAITYLQHMQVDKKVTDGTIRLILLQHLGEAVVTSDFGHELLQQTLQQCSDI
ncbi:MAG: 3-dehydroquinate synthase [Gammaproteobacteria bacterium]|nr:3-dehydroquinate synthase [Gammaproteobacteria bacterium]